MSVFETLVHFDFIFLHNLEILWSCMSYYRYTVILYVLLRLYCNSVCPTTVIL